MGLTVRGRSHTPGVNSRTGCCGMMRMHANGSALHAHRRRSRVALPRTASRAMGLCARGNPARGQNSERNKLRLQQRDAKHVLVPPGQSEPAQPPFSRGAGALSPILWKRVLVGVSSPAPPWLANVRSTSVGCCTPRIVVLWGETGVHWATPQNPSPQNDAVTLVGLYFLLPRASAPSLGGSLAWGARNFVFSLGCRQPTTKSNPYVSFPFAKVSYSPSTIQFRRDSRIHRSRAHE